MIAFAGHEFRLSRRGKDGKSLRETLETVARMRGVRPAELDNPAELSPLVSHVWRWFLDLNQTRQAGMVDSPLAWSEVESFARQMGLAMQRWEIRALRALDRLWLKEASSVS